MSAVAPAKEDLSAVAPAKEDLSAEALAKEELSDSGNTPIGSPSDPQSAGDQQTEQKLPTKNNENGVTGKHISEEEKDNEDPGTQPPLPDPDAKK